AAVGGAPAAWFARPHGLLEARAGDVRRVEPPPSLAGGDLTALLADGDRLLVGGELGVAELRRAGADGALSWRALDLGFPPEPKGRALTRDADGALWIGTSSGLFVRRGDTTRRYTRASGLSDDDVRVLLEDAERNLWIGTWSGGLCRLSDRGVERFT